MSGRHAARWSRKYGRRPSETLVGKSIPTSHCSITTRSQPIKAFQSIQSSRTYCSLWSRDRLPSGSISRPTASRQYASQAQNVKTTPLHDLHVSKKAKFAPFAGYSMPLYYDDLSHAESHHWTREKASIFDVSHMVQHKLSGPSAAAFLMQVTPTAVDSLPKYRSTLSCLLEDPSGGIVDDTVITRVGQQAFYFVTNAGCREKDLKFLQDEMTNFRETHDVKDENDLDWMVLDKHSLLALQGPKAVSVLQSLIFVDEEDPEIDTDLSTLAFSHARYLQLQLPEPGVNTPSLLVSRTGYTGEDGFEISIPPDSGSGNSKELAIQIAQALLADASTVRLAGLAARDSLRLEAGMCLYGHDIDLSTTPPEAGLGWTVSKQRRLDPSSSSCSSSSITSTASKILNPTSKKSTPPFNGSTKILTQLSNPKTMSRRRVALIVEKGAPAREGADIISITTDPADRKADRKADDDGEPDSQPEMEVVGKVTSGLPSPTLGGTNIAMGLVRNGWHKRGTKLAIRVRKNVRQAEVVKMPFVENRFFRG